MVAKGGKQKVYGRAQTPPNDQGIFMYVCTIQENTCTYMPLYITSLMTCVTRHLHQAPCMLLVVDSESPRLWRFHQKKACLALYTLQCNFLLEREPCFKVLQHRLVKKQHAPALDTGPHVSRTDSPEPTRKPFRAVYEFQPRQH